MSTNANVMSDDPELTAMSREEILTALNYDLTAEAETEVWPMVVQLTDLCQRLNLPCEVVLWTQRDIESGLRVTSVAGHARDNRIEIPQMLVRLLSNPELNEPMHHALLQFGRQMLMGGGNPLDGRYAAEDNPTIH